MEFWKYILLEFQFRIIFRPKKPVVRIINLFLVPFLAFGPNIWDEILFYSKAPNSPNFDQFDLERFRKTKGEIYGASYCLPSIRFEKWKIWSTLGSAGRQRLADKKVLSFAKMQISSQRPRPSPISGPSLSIYLLN